MDKCYVKILAVLSIETTGNNGQKLVGNGGELLKEGKQGNCAGMNGGGNWRR
jgi:hypothetical protein